MKITYLEIRNFLALSSATLSLADRGLVLIQGENRDDPSANSNGAGKSSLVEALCWALYGKTAKGVSGDDVVNVAAGKGTMVQVRVEDGASVYLIRRYRKHPTGKNRLEVHDITAGTTSVDLTLGTDKLTQELVERIMGCPHEVFVAAIYAGQEAMPDLPAMSDKQLKVLIEEAAGVTTLERAYEIARRRRVEAASKTDLARLDEERAAAAVENVKERIEDARRAAALWEREREERVAALTAETRELIDEAREAADWLAANGGDLAKIDAEIAEIDAKLAGLKGEGERLAQLEAEAAKTARAAEREKTLAQNAVDATTERKGELERTRAGIGKPCSKCGRAHDAASLKASIDACEAAATAAEAKAREIIASARDARALAESSAESVLAFKRSMTDASVESALRANLSARRGEIERMTQARDRAKTAAVKRKGALDAERARENPNLAAIKEREAGAKRAADTHAEKRAAHVAATREQATFDTVAEVFGPKGVRAHILDTVTPYLNDRTAAYLGALSDGCISAIWQTLTKNGKGEVREKFTIDVTKKGAAQSFAALSGGEKRKVRIAAALALQDLVASRAAKPIDLWVGDEIDAALDAAGLERLMNVLQDKARERGTVLVISHTDLRDWIMQTLTVVKENDMATLA